MGSGVDREREIEEQVSGPSRPSGLPRGYTGQVGRAGWKASEVSRVVYALALSSKYRTRTLLCDYW